jgi:hypothetical protein
MNLPEIRLPRTSSDTVHILRTACASTLRSTLLINEHLPRVADRLLFGSSSFCFVVLLFCGGSVSSAPQKIPNSEASRDFSASIHPHIQYRASDSCSRTTLL